VNILGVQVCSVNLDRAVCLIEDWIRLEARTYVCVTGVHGVMECQRDPELRLIHNNAGLVTPDGMPVVRIGQLKGFRDMDRVYGPDLMLEVFRRSASAGYRHFLYGTTDETLARLRSQLNRLFPGIQIVDVFAPPFRALSDAEAEQIVERINFSKADIVWVGLSTPKQERWMAGMRARLSPAVLVGVGAAFDFHAGNVRRAPRWMQRGCLEWLFRLCVEPRRLWRRYAVNNPRFLWLISLQFLGLRRFDVFSE